MKHWMRVAGARHSRHDLLQVETDRHLFVDGYNLLHAWRLLGEARTANLAAARHQLIDAARVVHDVAGMRVTVVFDGSGEAVASDPVETGDGFEVVFAPGDRTADTVIEMRVAAAASPSTCVVATGDALERETVLAAGASCISPEELRAWVNRCRERAARSARRQAGAGEFANKLPL